MFDDGIEVPNSWVWTAIREVAESMQNGIYKPTQFYSDDGVACLRMYNIENGSIVWKDIKRMNLTQEEIQNFELKPGDILVNRVNSRELVGKAAPITLGLEICIYESKNIRLRLFKDFIESKFIGVWFRIYSQKYFTKNAQQTVGMASINQEQLGLMPLPLPPLNEQRRIVAKIEALKARTQKAKEALEAIPPLLDQFRQSVLAAAFRGDLTADWREKNPDFEPTLELLKRTASQLNKNFDAEAKQLNECKQFIPNKWAWTPLDLVVKNIQAGKNFSCPEIPVTKDTVGLLKISAVTWGFFDERETKTVLDQTKVNSSLFIQKGDFLISRANTIELVGASVVVDEIKYRIMLSDKVWRVNFLEVESRYINFYLKSKSGRKEIESKATGNQLSMRNISQSAFREIVIALPSQEEQKEIVRRIEFLFKSADKIEQQYREVKAHLELLNQSILAKAFRGELVPQDPNDEPASVLLQRI